MNASCVPGPSTTSRARRNRSPSSTAPEAQAIGTGAGAMEDHRSSSTSSMAPSANGGSLGGTQSAPGGQGSVPQPPTSSTRPSRSNASAPYRGAMGGGGADRDEPSSFWAIGAEPGSAQ